MRGARLLFLKPWHAMAVVLVFAAPLAASADAVVVRDATGRSVTINDSRRIVSVGGAITEILYALGLESRARTARYRRLGSR